MGFQSLKMTDDTFNLRAEQEIFTGLSEAPEITSDLIEVNVLLPLVYSCFL